MSLYPSLDNFISFLKCKNNEDNFLSPSFQGFRDKEKNLIVDKGYTFNRYLSIRDEIKDIEVVPEDSHFLLYFFKDNIKYITKIRFSEDKLINSLVEEIYNEDNAQCVLVIEYDGSKYYGMQKQKRDDENTIQEEIEKALKLMMKRDVLVYPASRTDKGVHAKGQVLHFYANHIEAEKYMYALNNILPKDIRIKDAYIRSQLFNSRYDSILKTYNYVIDMGEYNVFMNNYVYYYKVKNISLMRNEMKSLLGTHDFKAFSKGKKEDTVRTIYDASLHLEGERLILSFTGNGFLHNMIRFIVGSLIEIDKKGFGSIKVILDSKDKNKTPILAPAEGLYLISIKY